MWPPKRGTTSTPSAAIGMPWSPAPPMTTWRRWPLPSTPSSSPLSTGCARARDTGPILHLWPAWNAIWSETLPSSHSVPLRAVARPAVNGGVPPRSFGLPSFGSPRRWSLTPVVTALLVITLLAGYLVFIRPQEPPVIVPIVAPEATPATPAAATPAVPFWRTVPPPQVSASVVWQIDGPQSTGTGLSSQLSVDPKGNIWVMDGANGRFQIYDKDGGLVDTWGEAGSREGQFHFQRANGEVVGNLAFTPLHADESFYVADSQNARIQVFDSERNFLRSWGDRGTGDGQFLEPISVWVSFEGLVFVLDDQRADVQIFDTDGTFIRKLGESRKW